MKEDETILIKPSSPCQYCKERYVGCHAKCVKFDTYSKALNEYNVTIRHRRHMQGIGYTGPVSKTKMAQIDRKKGR